MSSALLLAAGRSESAEVPQTSADSATSSAPDQGKTELAPIVVDAAAPEKEAALVERSFDTPEDVSGFGETIFAEPLWRGFETTAQLLGQSVGAQVLRKGGRDDFSTLTIRGAPAAQVRILLDGIALGRASDSVVNLAELPLDTIERIEVYRGFAPVGLTPVSAAGVVNVVTRDPKEATASAAAGGGSLGSAKVTSAAAGPVAGGSAAAFASWRRTDGDFRYVDDNGTLNNPNDDRVRRRANNDSNTVESLLRWRRDAFDGARLQIRDHVFYKEEGVPGIARFAPIGARLETVRDIAATGIGDRDGRWSVEQGLTWQSKTLSGYGSLDNTGETTATTTTARWGRPLPLSNFLSGSAEYSWEDFSQHNRSLANAGADRSSLAIAVGDDWSFAPTDTTLSLQLRHQELWNDAGGAGGGRSSDRSTDPRLGLRWQVLEGLAVKTNVSTYFRPPNFDELYGTDGFTTGNPELKPEEGLAFDAGFEWTFARNPIGDVSIGYSYFGSDIDNVILVWLDQSRMAKARNLGGARIRGHEARVEWKGPLGLALSANYTFQDTENRADAPELRGKQLSGLAPHEAWTRLSWTHELIVIAYDVEITGALFTDPENTPTGKLATRAEHSLSMVVGPFWKGLRVTLEADNLGDTLVPDPIGFPLPGRTFYATLSWSAAAEQEHADAH